MANAEPSGHQNKIQKGDNEAPSDELGQNLARSTWRRIQEIREASQAGWTSFQKIIMHHEEVIRKRTNELIQKISLKNTYLLEMLTPNPILSIDDKHEITDSHKSTRGWASSEKTWKYRKPSRNLRCHHITTFIIFLPFCITSVHALEVNGWTTTFTPGQDARIPCSYTPPNQKLEFIWWYNGQTNIYVYVPAGDTKWPKTPLVNRSDYEHTLGNTTLIIKDARESDAGQYACEITDIEGSMYAVASLEVFRGGASVGARPRYVTETVVILMMLVAAWN